MNRIKKKLSFWLSRLIDLVWHIDHDFANKLRYCRLFKRWPDLRQPRTFGEKIMARMRLPEFEQLADYADKWKVREYIAETIGDEYNIPLLAVYDSPDKVRYDLIPEGAYIKLNHASNCNIVFHKAQTEEIKQKIELWFNTDFSENWKEMQYKPIKRKILVQPDIAADGHLLRDICFFIFSGELAFVQMRDPLGVRVCVDRHFKEMPFSLNPTRSPLPEKPACFDRVCQMAEMLAKPFTFVRVDFFLVDDKPYFGELTFSPGAGIRMFCPYEYNLIFGDMIPMNIFQSPQV